MTHFVKTHYEFVQLGIDHAKISSQSYHSSCSKRFTDPFSTPM